MEFETFDIEGPCLIKPKVWADQRGHFIETFKEAWFRQTIVDVAFIQDNQALSLLKGTIRALHFQMAPMAQGKLVSCPRGAIFDVAVDIRPQSKTFGHWLSAHLDDQNHHQLWVPEGFAHGYCTLSDNTVVSYKVTNPYSPAHERGLAFDDPDIGIVWPHDLRSAILSDKDRHQPSLDALERDGLR